MFHEIDYNTCSQNQVDLLVERLSNENLYFKSQQRDEPDISALEKQNILKDLIENKPFLFLTRYGSHLLPGDFTVFNENIQDDNIKYLINQLKKSSDAKSKAVLARNRRFEAMNRLTNDGDYFSMDEMKFREPLLFEQMVGKYLTNEEKEAKIDRSDLRFSTILYKHMDVLEENDRYKCQKMKEDSQFEEEDSENESEEDDSVDNDESEIEEDNDDVDIENNDDLDLIALKYKHNGLDKGPEVQLSTEEKNLLKEEFQKIVKDMFIDGKDSLFDYSKVDHNADYDCLEIRQMDEEEKYFDDEEPENIETDSCSSLSDYSEEKD